MTFPFPHTNAGLKYAEPGTVEYTIAGSHDFVIPRYKNSLVVEAWGAGAGGHGPNTSSYTLATAGSASTFGDTLSAGGGQVGPQTVGSGLGGLGGIATGGDININGGQSPATTAGGDCPNGGTGGAAAATGKNGNPGSAPGGGGSGSYQGNINSAKRKGGGGGAYVKKTFFKGDLTPEAVLHLVVGLGGNGGTNTYSGVTTWGGDGAVGKIKISWT